MTPAGPLLIADIPWLRQASQKTGALNVPGQIAAKLLKGGFVEHDLVKHCLRITRRGQLALTRLC